MYYGEISHSTELFTVSKNGEIGEMSKKERNRYGFSRGYLHFFEKKNCMTREVLFNREFLTS